MMHMKSKYNVSRVLEDFDLAELTKGLTFALTEDLHYKSQKGRISLFGTLNRCDKAARHESHEEGFIALACRIAAGKDQTYGVEICIDEDAGDFIYSHCGCSSFQNGFYCCEHTCALLCSYLLKEGGIEDFQGTILENELKKATGCNTPFLPGILKKTDSELLDFTKQKRKSDKILPIWLTDPKDTQKKLKSSDTALLGVDLILTTIRASLGLELRVGPKRRYVIRNMDLLLESYQDNTSYSFTPTLSLPAGRNAYTEQSKKIMDFLCSLYNVKKRNDNAYNFFWNSYSDNRMCSISGSNMDSFMELMNHEHVSYVYARGEGIDCRIMLDKEALPLTMEKETYGAKLTIPDDYLVGCGLTHMYLIQKNEILRLPVSEWNKRGKLIKNGPGKRELYVRDEDLPAVISELAFNTDTNESTGLILSGMELTEYLPEVPSAYIYLDYPQTDMISAEVKVKYASKDKEFNLFDQKKGSRQRNKDAERSIAEKIWPFFTSFDQNAMRLYLTCDESGLYEFLTNTIPRLAQIGEVLISDQLKKFRVRSTKEMDVGIRVDCGSLVMSLKSNVLSKDELIQCLSSYDRKRKFTRLKNGEFITMDPAFSDTWETLSEAFKAYGRKDPEALRMPLFRALYLNEMLRNREEISLSQETSYTDLIEQLNDNESRDYKVPESLKDILRSYQTDGFNWVSMLKENGFGGILADDMGLGKTLQLLAFLLAQKEAGKEKTALRSLIVCPASLVYNWKKEVKTYTPGLTCTVIAGTAAERKKILAGIGTEAETDLYITSYDLLKRDVDLYENIHFANQIIDEAQYIKNQTTQAAKAVRLIDSEFRMALTGTPIENRLSELWSIFDYLMPGFLYSYTRFRTEYENPVITEHNEYVMDKLRRMVHPFILRRMKKDVLKDLPDKLEETIAVVMDKDQRKLYDAYAERLRLYLDKQSDEEFHQNKLEILAELTKLRQICCGPELLLEKYRGTNAKKEACIELVGNAIDGGHKVLLFSQFTSVLDELGQALKKEKILYHRIDGSVKKEERMRLVESFDTDEVPVFLISLKAGGTGLNLTAADIVIHYDPWWNLAAQNQATDRAHRIGQTNTVTVYQLIAENTVEEQIVTLQNTKAQLAKDILDGEGIASIMIRKDDLLALL